MRDTHGALALANDPWTVEQTIEEFIEWGTGRGHSLATLVAYDKALRKNFLPWCQAQGIERLEDVTLRIIDQYHNHVRSRPRRDGKPGTVSGSTMAWLNRPLRTMLEWARQRGAEVSKFQITDPAEKVRVVRIIDDAEQRKLENYARQRGQRDYLIVWLMGRRGLRAEEVVLITQEDLLEETYDGKREHYVRVMGKGRGGHGAERKVPLPPAVYREMHQLSANPPPTRSEGYVFMSRKPPYGRLTAKALWQMVSAMGQFVLKRNDVHPHLLRHSFVTKCDRRGMNDRQIALFAGNHNSIKRYSHLGHRDGTEILRENDLD